MESGGGDGGQRPRQMAVPAAVFSDSVQTTGADAR